MLGRQVLTSGWAVPGELMAGDRMPAMGCKKHQKETTSNNLLIVGALMDFDCHVFNLTPYLGMVDEVVYSLEGLKPPTSIVGYGQQ